MNCQQESAREPLVKKRQKKTLVHDVVCLVNTHTTNITSKSIKYLHLRGDAITHSIGNQKKINELKNLCCV